MTTVAFNNNRGLNFRPRSEFVNEADYLVQFIWLARPKLTKKLFFQLQAGLYLWGNGGDLHLVIGPESERAAQWNSIGPSYRQRLCMIFRNKAHYEAMLAEGQRTGEEKNRNSVVPFDPFNL